MKVVCDSTVLIGLSKIGEINLLRQIFKEVYIPEAVFNEVIGKGKGRPGVKEIDKAEWIQKEVVKDKRTVEMLIAEIGQGEAEVLILGNELNADWLIIDDERARTAAVSAGFNVNRTCGYLAVIKTTKTNLLC